MRRGGAEKEDNLRAFFICLMIHNCDHFPSRDKCILFLSWGGWHGGTGKLSIPGEKRLKQREKTSREAFEIFSHMAKAIVLYDLASHGFNYSYFGMFYKAYNISEQPHIRRSR